MAVRRDTLTAAQTRYAPPRGTLGIDPRAAARPVVGWCRSFKADGDACSVPLTSIAEQRFGLFLQRHRNVMPFTLGAKSRTSREEA